MIVSGFTFNAFAENTYLLTDASGACAIVDPGCSDTDEQQALQQYIQDENLRVELLLNTHCHIDHVFGNRFVLDTWPGTPFLMHEADLPTLRMAPASAARFGLSLAFQPSPEPTGFLTPGQPLRFGETELEVRFTPGHAPGHVVFYHPPTKTVLGGDVLFRGSIGRTDLPGGDTDTLLRSIREQLFTLPDDTIVYPGHGPATTIGVERVSNPFLRY
jgi:hydroxyacylglutathione hydrolase